MGDTNDQGWIDEQPETAEDESPDDRIGITRAEYDRLKAFERKCSDRNVQVSAEWERFRALEQATSVAHRNPAFHDLDETELADAVVRMAIRLQAYVSNGA